MTSAATLMLRARLFRFHAAYLWRFHRLFVKKHLHRRCVTCSVSEAYSPLDARGVCAECLAYAAAPQKEQQLTPAVARSLEAELDALFRGYEGKGEAMYDALVLFSGGKDSALLIHELRQRYPGLRILALLGDNSYMSPVALENAATAAEALNVDLITLKVAKSFYRKSFRLACRRPAEGKGAFQTADMIDAYILTSLAVIHAALNKIPLLVSGLSWSQVERIYGVRSYETPQDLTLDQIESIIGKKLDQIYDPSEMRYFCDAGRFAGIQQPRFIHPFFVWRYKEQDIQKRVVELGLIKPGKDSPLLTNHLVIILMVVSDYLHLGYGSYESDFAMQVRAGMADRVFWRNVFEMLEYSAKTGWMLDKELDKILADLELTREEVGLVRPNTRRPQSVGHPAP